MARPRQIESGIQLLVEGNDQRNFFEAFVRHLSLPDMQIQNFGGVDELRGFLSAFVKMQKFLSVKSIGIVRDAETSAAAALQSIRSSLENAGLPAPSHAGEKSGDNPMVTVLILPDNNDRGMLETLLCRTFENADVNRCIDDFFQCAEVLPHVSIARPDKARAHAYLATRPDPHISVGVAAQRGYWDLDHDVFAGVRGFLTGL